MKGIQVDAALRVRVPSSMMGLLETKARLHMTSVSAVVRDYLKKSIDRDKEMDDYIFYELVQPNDSQQ